MKGLILKDFYMAKKYCRMYLLICAVFILISVFGENSMFLVFYPCILGGIVPVTLLGYDERSKWSEYADVLPYSRAQIVSGKYIVGLIIQISVVLLVGIAQAARMIMNGGFDLTEFGILLLMLVAISTYASSLSLPFLFKFGLDRGRAAYYVMVGAICAISVIASNFFMVDTSASIELGGVLWIIAIVSLCIYALSWYLSIVFYNKREL